MFATGLVVYYGQQLDWLDLSVEQEIMHISDLTKQQIKGHGQYSNRLIKGAETSTTVPASNVSTVNLTSVCVERVELALVIATCQPSRGWCSTHGYCSKLSSMDSMAAVLK